MEKRISPVLSINLRAAGYGNGRHPEAGEARRGTSQSYKTAPHHASETHESVVSIVRQRDRVIGEL
jgi:hypothetical protein